MEMQWPLMIFTLFVCLGAGIFSVQGLLLFVGKDRNIQVPCLIASLVSIVIGGIGSFLHLEHWERIFNGFGHLSSGITQELIAIAVFVVALFIYYLVLKRSEENAPKWLGIMALVISIALVIIMSLSYHMPARPVWATLLLWFYYLANMVLFGGLAVAVISGLRGVSDVDLPLKIAAVGGIAQVVATAAYAFYFTVVQESFTSVGYYFDPTHPTKEMIDPTAVFNAVLSGEYALLFWGGAVILGALIPLVAVFLSRKKSPKQLATYAALGLICALVGGFCFRTVLYVLGFSVFVFY